jgi:hypothetical protein
MGVVCSFETSANLYQTTRRHMPQDGNSHCHRREEIKCGTEMDVPSKGWDFLDHQSNYQLSKRTLLHEVSEGLSNVVQLQCRRETKVRSTLEPAIRMTTNVHQTQRDCGYIFRHALSHPQVIQHYTKRKCTTTYVTLLKLISQFCYDYTTPCFVLLCFNAPCQLTPLLNLPPLIFGLTPFGWLHSIALTPYLLWEYHFCFTPVFHESN